MPQERIPAEARKDYPKLTRHVLKIAGLIDDLGRLDEQSQEVRIDENSLRKLVREVAPGSEDAIVEKLRGVPGSNLVKSGKGLKPISWEALTERMAPRLPQVGMLSAEAARLTAYSSLADIRAAVQAQAPGFPADAAFDMETLNSRCKAALAGAAESEPAPTALPGNVWDCMVRNLGFWGAVAAVALAVLVVSIVAFILAVWGPTIIFAYELFWGLFWIIFWEWLGPSIPVLIATVVLIVGCIVFG
jgi:hypothetical protein